MNWNRNTVGAVAGFTAGSALVYLLDPQSGRRRRARMRDKSVHVLHQARLSAEAVRKDLAHRFLGLTLKTTHRLEEERVDDRVLHERVRAELGRVCSHPSAIEVVCQDGDVQLFGPVLRHEVRQVLWGVSRVRGVRDVVNRLDPHEKAGDVPGLQGGIERHPVRFELQQQHWAPGPRFLAGAFGLGLAGLGLRRRGALGSLAGLAGAGLFLRSMTNLPLRRMFGVTAEPQTIALVKQLEVDAPVEQVFAFWRQLENLPSFLSHVKEVRPLEGGRYHWKVEGPAGIPVEWEAEISAFEPNRLLAWRSLEGAAVRSLGIVRFEPHGQAATRLHIRMSYRPLAGAIGHALAKLLGADPGKQLDDDLLRFKSLVEAGKAREEPVSQEELGPQPEDFYR
ncbi:MAG: SRPBCC family protein [Myxococcaceae bacterium]